MSISDGIPVGLFDPVFCRKSRWTVTMAEMMKGSRKCRAKNQVSGALSTENTPQTHSTRFVPMYGIAESGFVITVTPQKDLWPHGST